MAVKTFTTGEVLTASDTNTYLANAGLVYVTSASLSAVTNTFTNVFSSTYDSYRIVVNNMSNATTTTREFYLRMGTDSSAYYGRGEQYIFGAGSNAVNGTTGQTSAKIGNLSLLASSGFVLDIHAPNKAAATVWTYQAMTYQSDVGAYVFRSGYGFMDTLTQYTGFQIIGTVDNLSGNVTVYGYRKG